MASLAFIDSKLNIIYFNMWALAELYMSVVSKRPVASLGRFSPTAAVSKHSVASLCHFKVTVASIGRLKTTPRSTLVNHNKGLFAELTKQSSRRQVASIILFCKWLSSND